MTDDCNFRYLFYAMYDDISGTSMIIRCNLDGSNKTVLENKKLIKIMGITLDYANQHLYWIEQDMVQRINYDGTMRYIIFSNLHVMVCIISFYSDFFLLQRTLLRRDGSNSFL